MQWIYVITLLHVTATSRVRNMEIPDNKNWRTILLGYSMKRVQNVQ